MMAALSYSAALLPGLLNRADVAVFPVDCVSHDAAAAVKRVCAQLGKRYLPLRTASLTCLRAGLAALQAAPAPAEPVTSRLCRCQAAPPRSGSRGG